MRYPFPVLLTVAALATGCSSSLTRAVHSLDHGAYTDAVARFQQLEADLADMGPPKRARYCLYRGLAHLALDDRAEATRWLAEAKALHDWNDTLLAPREAGRLIAAWDALGYEPGLFGATVQQGRPPKSQ